MDCIAVTGVWTVAEPPREPRRMVCGSGRANPEEAVIAAAMARYQQIRRTREAEGLRELFVDPMIVHGPGPTREEYLDEFVRRVAAERQTMPGSVMEAPDCLLAGNKAILRWSYSHPDSTVAKPSPIVGLTLYAFWAGNVGRLDCRPASAGEIVTALAIIALTIVLRGTSFEFPARYLP